MDQYREVLFQQNMEPHKVQMSCLRLNADKKMARYRFIKKGLCDLFFKMQVNDDAITCSPLKENGQFL